MKTKHTLFLLKTRSHWLAPDDWMTWNYLRRPSSSGTHRDLLPVPRKGWDLGGCHHIRQEGAIFNCLHVCVCVCVQWNTCESHAQRGRGCQALQLIVLGTEPSTRAMATLSHRPISISLKSGQQSHHTLTPPPFW